MPNENQPKLGNLVEIRITKQIFFLSPKKNGHINWGGTKYVASKFRLSPSAQSFASLLINMIQIYTTFYAIAKLVLIFDKINTIQKLTLQI